MGSPPRRESVLLGLIAAIAVGSAAWPAYRAFVDVEIDFNEGWNAFWADAAMGRRPLYPTQDELVTNNYPPLSFYLVGAAGRLLGDPILAGRLLSLASVVAIAVAVALCVRRLGGDRRAAAVGGLFFGATLGRFFSGYVGMNDPHLLGQAVMCLAFVAFLGAVERDRGYWLAIVLMVFAGFIKHNVIAIPLTAAVWLCVRRPHRILPAGVLAVAALAGGFALCHFVYGPDFLANLLSPRGTRWSRVLDTLGYLQWVAVGLVVSLHLGVVRRADPGVRLSSLLVLVALATYLLQMSGDGVSYNAQFELVFAAAVGLGLTFHHAPPPPRLRWSPERVRFALLLAVVLRLAASARVEAARVAFDSRFRAEIAAREAAMRDTVARAAATPGDVFTGPYVAYRAGKAFVVEVFNCQQRMRAGRLPPDAIERLVASGRLSRVAEDPLLHWGYELPSDRRK